MSESGREALPDVRKWSGGLPGFLGVVLRPSRMSGSGLEDLPDDREWSGSHLGCPRVVGRYTCMSEVVGRPSRMSVSGREDSRMSGCLLGSPGFLGGSGGPPRCPVVVSRNSRNSGSDREALPDVREW